jgi:hypothetical protein
VRRDGAAAEELYIIGPIDPSMPQSTSPIDHDHVIPLPPNNGGAFNAVWEVHKVVGLAAAVNAGAVLVRPTGLAYEADLGDGLVPPTQARNSSAPSWRWGDADPASLPPDPVSASLLLRSSCIVTRPARHIPSSHDVRPGLAQTTLTRPTQGICP